MKDGETYIAFEDADGIHVIGDGNDETYCGKRWDPEGSWWIATWDGETCPVCTECLRALMSFDQELEAIAR